MLSSTKNEVCQMQDARVYLELVRERGNNGLPLERVYRQLFNRELYLIAYGKLYRNEGATTKGATEETVDGMSLAKIDAIIAALRTERYRWTPLADHLASSVEAPGLPFPHPLKRPLRFILIGSQQGHHLPSFELLLSEKFSRHAFPVDDDVLHHRPTNRLFVAMEREWESHRQVLVAPVYGCQKWMPLRIVQEYQFATSQDFPIELAHRSARNEHRTVDSLTMSIHPRRKQLGDWAAQWMVAPPATVTRST
jgi:hypothetical protein